MRKYYSFSKSSCDVERLAWIWRGIICSLQSVSWLGDYAASLWAAELEEWLSFGFCTVWIRLPDVCARVYFCACVFVYLKKWVMTRQRLGRKREWKAVNPGRWQFQYKWTAWILIPLEWMKIIHQSLNHLTSRILTTAETFRQCAVLFQNSKL